MKVEEKHLATVGTDTGWHGLDKAAAAIDADTDHNSPSLDGLNFNAAAIQVVWTGVNNSPAIKLQESLDGVSWEDVSGETATMTPAGGSAILKLPDLATRFVRTVYTKGTASAGSFTLRALLKTK